MRQRFFLMENPAAGIAGSPLVDGVVDVLARQGAAVTRARGEDIAATREAVRGAAASGRYDAIIAAGGDGTIRQVAAALLGGPVPLGIIPVGTGNVLAHEIGLVRKPRDVAQVLRAGPAVDVACAEANGEPFLLMVGVGFDARVVAALSQRLKSRLGKAAYAGPLLSAIAKPADPLDLEIDGRRHTANWAVVANACHYGGKLALAPHTHIARRGLQAVLFKTRSRAVLLAQLVTLFATGRLAPAAARGREVEMHACSQVTVTAPHPVPAQVDGDVFGSTPVEVHAGRRQLSLIVPPAAAGGLGNSTN